MRVFAQHGQPLLQGDGGAGAVHHQTDAVLSAAEFLAAAYHVLRRGVYAGGGAAGLGHGKADLCVVLKADHNNAGSAHDPGHLRAEKSQGTGAKDDDVLTGEEVGLLGEGLVGVADGVQDGSLLVGDVFGDLPQGLGMNPQDLAGDQAVLCETAAVAVAQAEIDLFRALEEVSRHAGRALAAHVGGVVGDNPLSNRPIGHALADGDDLAGKLVAADRVEFRRAVVDSPVVHVRAAYGRGLHLDDDVLLAADRLRHIHKAVGSQRLRISIFDNRFHSNLH